MKILNLFLKVKVINFQALEVETKNLTLLQLDLLLIITTLVECRILHKNMLKKKINLQWQNKENITLWVRMTPNQHLPKNGLLKETLKTLKFWSKNKDTKLLSLKNKSKIEILQWNKEKLILKQLKEKQLIRTQLVTDLRNNLKITCTK